MTDHRALAADLCMADAMPFQQHHEYRTTLPIEAVLAPRFFLNLRGNLRPGDAITICRFTDRAWQRLTAVAEARVVSVGDDGVRLHLRYEIEAIAAPGPGVTRETATAPVERFAGADWTAVHRGFGRWSVLDAAGREKVANLGKDTAAGIVRGDVPLPDDA